MLKLFFLLTLAMAFPVLAEAANKTPVDLKVFISVGKTDGSIPSREWATQKCVELHNLLLLSSKAQLESKCDLADRSDSFELGIDVARRQGKYTLHVKLLEGRDSSWVVTIENLKKSCDTDFTQTTTVLAGSHGPLRKTISESQRKTALQSYLQRFFNYHQNVGALKEMFLQELASEIGATVEVQDRGGKKVFLSRSTGEVLTSEEAYKKFVGEKPENKKFMRTVLEIGAILGLGTLVYEKGAFGPAEPEQESYRKALKYKLTGTEWIRFEDNSQAMNFLNHPLSGAVYHQIARSNGYGKVASLLFGFTASLMWEYGAEMREVASLNDMIVTPATGFILGEVGYKFSEFLSRGDGSKGKRLLAAVMSPASWFNRKIDSEKAQQAAALDSLGFPADVWHQFKLSIGATAQKEAWVELEGKLIDVKGYAQEGKSRGWLTDSPLVAAKLETIIGKEGLKRLDLYGKLVYSAYHKKNIQSDSDGNLKGYEFLIGPAADYNYVMSETGKGIKDVVGKVGILGSSMDLTYFLPNKTVLKMVVDMYGDFAMVRSLAIDQHSSEFGLEGAKGVLKKRQAYYALGLSTNAETTVSKGRFEAGGSYRRSSYDSIEGLDIAQASADSGMHPRPPVTDDFNLKDKRTDSKLWLSFTPIKDRLKLTLGYRDLGYWGKIKSTEVTSHQAGLFGKITLGF
ncbi:MAG TPA: DUF3943 domain-containing protein [Bacteriovoracaceae bacterium]|nr:DUF3943 domain-containing protein [Bacteriovoracaceae bacterium]